MMKLLFETQAGFALFEVLNETKLSNLEDLANEFLSPVSARKMVKLIAFYKFENTSVALESLAQLVDGVPSEGLLKFLNSNYEGEVLAVADSKLGDVIKEKLNIDCVYNIAVMELLRGVRSQFNELISDLDDQDLAPMSFGLSHSFASSKLNLSSDEVDTLVIETIDLLDALDKELKTYATKVRDWYGCHFPELEEIVADDLLYTKSVKLMGNRTNAAKLDFSEILEEEVEVEVKEAALVSTGTELSDLDLVTIRELCDDVLSVNEQKAPLFDTLKSSMNILAPNLTALVGEVVGARLISHSGSLFNLSKLPASTIQILGAEKALFRAFRRKHATPKYGFIYNAPIVVQASTEHKGKIARTLAAKVALAIRSDVYGDGEDNTMGLQSYAKVEARLRHLERQDLHRVYVKEKAKFEVNDGEKVKKIESCGGWIKMMTLFVCFVLVLFFYCI